MSKLHFLLIKLFSFRLAHPVICVITANCNNELILHEKTCPISKCRELEIGLEFQCYGFDDLKNFSGGSFKPKKDIQTVQVQELAVLLLCTNRDISSIGYIMGWKITRNTIIV